MGTLSLSKIQNITLRFFLIAVSKQFFSENLSYKDLTIALIFVSSSPIAPHFAYCLWFHNPVFGGICNICTRVGSEAAISHSSISISMSFRDASSGLERKAGFQLHKVIRLIVNN